VGAGRPINAPADSFVPVAMRASMLACGKQKAQRPGESIDSPGALPR
jgi:hypothetical protein